MYVCMYVCMYVRMHISTTGNRKKAPEHCWNMSWKGVRAMPNSMPLAASASHGLGFRAEGFTPALC